VVEHEPDILNWPFRRFREFAANGGWRDLPATMQRALVRLWRVEQDVERVRRKRTSKE